MTNATSETTQIGAVFWRLYMLSWVGLAGAALIYLAAAVVHPDLLKPLVSQPVASATTNDEIVSSKIETLERTLNSLESKLASVESKVRQRWSLATTATAEPKSASDDDAQPKLPAVIPATSPNPKTTQLETPKVAKAPSGRVPPLPSRAPDRTHVASVQPRVTGSDGPEVPLVILNGVAAAGIATGSVNREPPQQQPTAPAPQANRLPEIVRNAPAVQQAPSQSVVAFGKPTVETTPNSGTSKSIVVSVASSIDKLRSDWDLLTARHPQLLRNLQPRYDIMAANGPYRLLVGPLMNRSEAGQLCNVLQLHGVTCDIEDNFLGNAL